MSSTEEHKKKIIEHYEIIGDAIDYGIEQRPTTIGFHCSACIIQLLELYLHKLNLISIGKMIKHNWFKRPKLGQKIIPLIERKLPVNFPDKETIYDLFYDIEDLRDNLIYGKGQLKEIEKVLESYSKAKTMIIEKLEELGEKIE